MAGAQRPMALLLSARMREAAPVVVVSIIVLVGAVLAGWGDPGARSPVPIGCAILLAAALSLVARHGQPVVVLTVCTVAGAVYWGSGFPAGPEPVPFVVALYAVASAGKRSAAAFAALGAPVVAGVVAFVVGDPIDLGDLMTVVAALAATVALGELARSRRAHLRAVADRAAGAERLRIAREMHDDLAHHLTVIIAQAGAALHRYGTRPEFAREALEVIRASSTEALRELRRTVGALRTADTVPTGGDLAGLSALISRIEATGLQVSASLPDGIGPVAAETERAAYRIVQEALTNVSRHSGARTARVSVQQRPDALVVEVVDDGVGSSVAIVPGGGVRSMTERVDAVGGELAAGPRPGGGFRVRAVLPARLGNRTGP